jgi:hypothetical protein
VSATAKSGKPIKVNVAFDDNLTPNMIRRGARADVKTILEQVWLDADWKLLRGRHPGDVLDGRVCGSMRPPKFCRIPYTASAVSLGDR